MQVQGKNIMANFDALKSATNNFKRFIENLVTFDDVGGAIPKSTLHQFNETLGIYPFSQFLPHQTFDPITNIYTTQYGRGFIFQAEPLVGVDAAVVKNLHQIFQNQLPIGACGQVMLNASNKIGSMLECYVDERHNALPVFKTMAQNRAKHAAKAAITSVIGQPFLLRD